jgi:hypothetical protein
MMTSPIALINKRKLSTRDMLETSGKVDLQWQGVDFKYLQSRCGAFFYLYSDTAIESFGGIQEMT